MGGVSLPLCPVAVLQIARLGHVFSDEILVTEEILNSQVLSMIYKMLFWYLALHLSAAEENLWGAEHRSVQDQVPPSQSDLHHFLFPWAIHFLMHGEPWSLVLEPWALGAEQSWVARRKWDLEDDKSRELDGWTSVVLDKVQTSQKWGNKSRFDGSSSKVNSKPMPISPAFWSGWTHFLGFMHCSQAPFWCFQRCVRPWLSSRLSPHCSPYVCVSFSLSILWNFFFCMYRFPFRVPQWGMVAEKRHCCMALARPLAWKHHQCCDYFVHLMWESVQPFFALTINKVWF